LNNVLNSGAEWHGYGIGQKPPPTVIDDEAGDCHDAQKVKDVEHWQKGKPIKIFYNFHDSSIIKEVV
jgi:hypothetical protein